MMIIVIYYSLLFGLAGAANGQVPAKVTYFEIGGPGLASINYDMRFTRSDEGIGGRLGIGGFSFTSGGAKVTSIFLPISVNYLFGNRSTHLFELGAGITPVILSNSYNGINENLKNTFEHVYVGYRFQPKHNGFVFRAGLSPIFNSHFFWPYFGGMAIGYKF